MSMEEYRILHWLLHSFQIGNMKRFVCLFVFLSFSHFNRAILGGLCAFFHCGGPYFKSYIRSGIFTVSLHCQRFE